MKKMILRDIQLANRFIWPGVLEFSTHLQRSHDHRSSTRFQLLLFIELAADQIVKKSALVCNK